MVNVREVDLGGSRTIRIVELEDAIDPATRKSVTGAWVWDASIVFATWLSHDKATWPEGSIKDLRVLELGAGLGLVGLAAAALGARVLLTDRDLRVLSGIRRNIKENALEGRAFAAQLEWGEGLPRQVDLRKGVFAERAGGNGGMEAEDPTDGRSTGSAERLLAEGGPSERGAGGKQGRAGAAASSGESGGLSAHGGVRGGAESEPLDVEDFVKDLDLIVGSDIMYEADLMPALCQTVKQLVGPRTRIFFSVELRPATPKCFHGMAGRA
ncbi:hypothetical protein CLOM_g20967 [Closterium sp. NIES-68]|nr:hypothetical protein CLOM_g20967 [Closterium sp. NIES-68]